MELRLGESSRGEIALQEIPKAETTRTKGKSITLEGERKKLEEKIRTWRENNDSGDNSAVCKRVQ